MEIELKLAIDPADIGRLRQSSLLARYAATAPQIQELTSIYFDTPDLQMRLHDAGLRVRQSNGTWVQTLKGGGSVSSGLHQRHEWETPVDGPHPDLAALRREVDAGSSWNRLLASPSLAQGLRPLFSTRIRRSLWLLQLPTETGIAEIECALDEGDITHEDKQIAVHEIELELKAGNPEHLFDFALRLLDEVPLRLDNVSKAARGYALAQGQQAAAGKAGELTLRRGMTIEQGFQAILSNCIEQLQSNEAGVLMLDDVESVHQMRVALRRMQAAFKLFHQAIPCPDAISDEFKWLADELGQARDWDVLSGTTLPRLNAQQSPFAAMPLAMVTAAAQDKARHGHETAAAAVGSVRYTRALLTLSGWLLGARWRDDAVLAHAADAPLGKFAHKMLQRSQRRLLRRGRHLKKGDARARHRVRIAAKQVRYATEFFQSRYPARRVRRYLHVLSALQDDLGGFNDATVAENLLQELSVGPLAADGGFARGYLAALLQGGCGKLPRHWRRFRHIEAPFAK